MNKVMYFNKSKSLTALSYIFVFVWVNFAAWVLFAIWRKYASIQEWGDILYAWLIMILIFGALAMALSFKIRCEACKKRILAEVAQDIQSNATFGVSRWGKIVFNAITGKPFRCPHCGREYTLKKEGVRP